MTGAQPFVVTVEETGETFRCRPGENVLKGMEHIGWTGIPVGCRGGGCGVCKVQVTSGSYERQRMSRAHVSATDEAMGIGLACRLVPRSDLVLRVLGVMRPAMTSSAQRDEIEPG